MKILWSLIFVFFSILSFAQNQYKLVYESFYNGQFNKDEDYKVVISDLDRNLITTTNTLSKSKEFPLEETLLYKNKPNTYIQLATFSTENDNSNRLIYYVDSTSISNQKFEFTNETKVINGYKCKKARINVNSNIYDFWFTDHKEINASPYILGANLGFVVEVNRNGNFVLKLKKVEKLKNKITFPDLSKAQEVDYLSFRDEIWKSSFTTLEIFKDQVINFKEEENSSDENFIRAANGTVVVKKIKLPKIGVGQQIFIDLQTYSNGDAYDRTGSVFLIPMQSDITFLDALQKSVSELPIYENGNQLQYQGIVKTNSYTPLIELMRFFTPFGINKFNTIKIKGKEWFNQVSYRQDITDLLPAFMTDEVWVGVYIGNYDKGGHMVSLNLTIHQDVNHNIQVPKLIPLFNTTNVLEMSGQNYGTLFNSEEGLKIKFSLDKEIKNAKLRYITTGHGGWENGDEFVPKKNRILLNNSEVFAFTPWRTDCGSYRLFNPASGNFSNGLSSSDYSRSNWCPGTLTNPIMIELGDLSKGEHTLQVLIPQGPTEGGSFSFWNVSGILIGD